MRKILAIVLSVLFVIGVSYGVAQHLVQRHRALRAVEVKAPVVPPAPEKPVEALPVPPAPPKLAIILDDWGNNYEAWKQAREIDRPLTLALLPHLRHTQAIAGEAQAKGFGVMLHMPMQPVNDKLPLEPQTIRTTSTDEEIRRFVDEALASIPQARGVNNHMGSKATSDERVMRVFLDHIRTKDLFYVDSRVIGTSVGGSLSEALGVPFAVRDVFIDNELDHEAITAQLRKAKEMAVNEGQAVVIGHDKPVTLRAIRDFLPELDRDGVQLVLVEELLERQSRNE